MIKETEKELFNEWKTNRGYDSFLEDGVFDEETYNNQNIKILYVLKEANWENGNCDLCEYLLSEVSKNYWHTWNNIVRWTAAIRGAEYPHTISKRDKTICLKTIAAINIKKVGGDARADDEEIREFGIRDAEYINKQINLYQPDIIICCGRGNGKNADILHDYVLKNVSEWKPDINGYNYYLANLNSKKNIPVVSYYHPQMRGGHSKFKELYDIMIQIASELRKQGYLK